MSFLINSLIAFKHKNDSEYVKQQAERIFHHLEVYANSDYTQLFFRSLAIYYEKNLFINLTDRQFDDNYGL
jgi:hypothetical protein